MKLLVVGASGFVGRRLVHALRQAGHRVEAWSRRDPDADAHLFRSVDLLAAAELPPPPEGGWDAVFQLAGHSRPGQVEQREQALENLAMTARTLDHLAERSPGCRAIVASSALVYGPSSEPHHEDEPLRPRNLYGLSKRLCETWAEARTSDLHVLIVRPFNLLGPGMPSGLLVPDLLERLELEQPVLEMQGRDALRDFLDVRDAVDAYLALLDADSPSGTAFNLCSGSATRVSTLARALLERAGARRELRFADPAPDVLVGSPERLRAATGWAPRHSLAATVDSIVEAARA